MSSPIVLSVPSARLRLAALALVVALGAPGDVLRAQVATVAVAPTLHVPAGGSPSTVTMLDLPVATRRLARGTVLGDRDMTIARIEVRGRALPAASGVTAGWVARRVIQPGEVLRPPAVAPAPLVRAGETVQFTYQHDGLQLTLDGVAPVAGSLGDTIPVRLGARRRVSGVVTGAARVFATDLSRTP